MLNVVLVALFGASRAPSWLPPSIARTHPFIGIQMPQSCPEFVAQIMQEYMVKCPLKHGNIPCTKHGASQSMVLVLRIVWCSIMPLFIPLIWWSNALFYWSKSVQRMSQNMVMNAGNKIPEILEFYQVNSQLRTVLLVASSFLLQTSDFCCRRLIVSFETRHLRLSNGI